MQKRLNWQGRRACEEIWFPARVPGNIQQDYAAFKGFPDVHFGENVNAFRALEDDVWLYRAEFDGLELDGERLFFVADGIDYRYEIRFNGRLLLEHEGMFTRAELDLTDLLLGKGNRLEITILPHPLAPETRRCDGRDEASWSCKPPVCYGWDWHPRLLSSGIWEDAWLETRGKDFIRECSCSYRLDEDLSGAEVSFRVDCGQNPVIRVWDPDGRPVYEGTDRVFRLENVRLWWCSGQGEQALYQYEVRTDSHVRTGRIGFRRVRLLMNEGTWAEPSGFPKTRSVPPVTLCLNGRKIFCKGSNFVRPELFPGEVDEEVLRPLVQLAKDAHMNFFRVWGGSEVNKEPFFELCDELGIMVWQEFPLACCCYPDDEHYLSVLRQEASAIILRVRQHPSLMLWCGGNELFNNWSGMTDQSLPLRLLNSLCYELDPSTPFLMTSPLMGMAHGGYLFRDYDTGKDVFTSFRESKNTAYTEFGVPGMPDPAYLREIIPEDELFPLRRGGSWELHHALAAWRENGWAHQDIAEIYFGKIDSLEQLCEGTQWLQCEGYKAIFEEARRQWPHCSMASNWCYNEPWKTAANNSLLCYPHQPKPAYEAVKAALRPVMPSARIPKFDWTEGELFTAELWLLNDSPEETEDTVTAFLELDGETVEVLQWKTGRCGPNAHKQGHCLQWRLPRLESGVFVLRLESGHGSSAYRLLCRPADNSVRPKILNM